MAKKKIIRAEDITDKDILSMYEGVLPILGSSSANIDPGRMLSESLKNFVQFDFRFYAIDDPNKEANTAYSVILDLTKRTDIFMSPSKGLSPEVSFDETIEMIYQKVVKAREDLFPDKPRKYHYHKMVSTTNPKIAIGFIRYKNSSTDNSFDANDLQKLELLSPHIFLLYRAIINDAIRTPSLQYFTVLTNICSDIAKKHELSDAEYKLIPEILFGLTNKQIAEKNFVSVAAIKKHIKHIFKKTDTKNRVDFISKFFTSPARINL